MIKRPVTQRDIANALGLSKATVSYVLAGQAAARRISPDTITRVEEKARELGYRPNIVARSLTTRRTGTVGVLASGFGLDWLSRVYSGMEEVFTREEVFPLFGVRHWEPEREHRELEQLLMRRVDGLLVCTPMGANRDLYLDIQRSGTPIVLLGDTLDGLDEISAVVWDASEALRRLVAALAAAGRRRFAFLGTRHDTVYTMKRVEAFRSAVGAAGLEVREDWIIWDPLPPLPHYPDNPVPTTVFGWAECGNPADRPDALVCLNDNVASRLLNAMLTSSHRVPEDFAIVGLGDLAVPSRAIGGHTLTTSREPLPEIGAAGAQLLMELVANPRRDPVVEVLETAEPVQGTTTPPLSF